MRRDICYRDVGEQILPPLRTVSRIGRSLDRKIRTSTSDTARFREHNPVSSRSSRVALRAGSGHESVLGRSSGGGGDGQAQTTSVARTRTFTVIPETARSKRWFATLVRLLRIRRTSGCVGSARKY